MIIYEGPSLQDGARIVAIAVRSARNDKTGDMVQIYIMLADMDPRLANKTGADVSICGDCMHKGTPIDPADPDFLTRTFAKNRSCYVQIQQGVLIVWKHYKAGGYERARDRREITEHARGAMVRFGTYGDPALVPSYIWDDVIAEASGFTGYSHQANNPRADYRPDLTMRSCDSELEAWSAWSRGERTFRVMAPHEKPVEGREIMCPAPRVKCTDCGLCAGTRKQAKSIAIYAHGAGKGHFNRAKEQTL